MLENDDLDYWTTGYQKYHSFFLEGQQHLCSAVGCSNASNFTHETNTILNISLGLNHSELGANCVISLIIIMKLLISMIFVCHG